jgi:large subunit ribosomal protein L18
MKQQKRKNILKQRRKWHIRKSVSGTAERPRLSVNRSLKNISVQVINDEEGKTIFGVSTLSKSFASRVSGSCGNVAAATELGKMVAELAKEKNIEKVVFDRSGYLYHGRVKALADGAREGGLDF